MIKKKCTYKLTSAAVTAAALLAAGGCEKEPYPDIRPDADTINADTRSGGLGYQVDTAERSNLNYAEHKPIVFPAPLPVGPSQLTDTASKKNPIPTKK